MKKIGNTLPLLQVWLGVHAHTHTTYKCTFQVKKRELLALYRVSPNEK